VLAGFVSGWLAGLVVTWHSLQQQLKQTFKPFTLAPPLTPIHCRHHRGLKVAADDEDDAEYDRAARELVFEAKSHAGERTLAPGGGWGRVGWGGAADWRWWRVGGVCLYGCAHCVCACVIM